MPYETRFFARTPADPTATYDRRDVYLLGSHPMWDGVGLKLRDVDPKCVVPSSQSCKLEVKVARGIPSPGVQMWVKVVKKHGMFQLGDTEKIMKQAADAVGGENERQFLTSERTHLTWVAVDKRVRKQDSVFGDKETSWLRITLFSPSGNVVVYAKTYSAESGDAAGPAYFLKSCVRETDVVDGYPGFLRQLCRTCLKSWSDDATVAESILPISAEFFVQL